MYKLLMWINKEYNNPPVIVTENGVSDNNGVNDMNRVTYLNSYLSAILDAMVRQFLLIFVYSLIGWNSNQIFDIYFLGGWLQN